MPVRVVIVDDSAFMRRVLRSMLTEDGAIEVIGIGRNGEDAVRMAGELRPDVMTLDIEMPLMDGLTALRRIMRDTPTNILMCSSLTTDGSQASLRAMKLGAVDVVAKDADQFARNAVEIQKELVARIKAIARDHALRRSDTAAPPAATSSSSGVAAPQAPPVTASREIPDYQVGQFNLIVIGSSTGGPPRLETILAGVPTNLNTPIVIAQHMPLVFTKTMAQRLDEICPLSVHHIEDNMMVDSGHVYIAPGGQHTHLRKVGLAKWRFEVSDEPKDHVYKPSVDALFTSAVDVAGKKVLGMVLTGIGEDGLRGGRRFKEVGASLVAQTPETCVVYGMPKAVTTANLIDASLTPEDMARALQRLVPAADQHAA